MGIKTKVNNWDLIKLKSFCTRKGPIGKVKRQPSEWAKIIANKATELKQRRTKEPLDESERGE